MGEGITKKKAKYAEVKLNETAFIRAYDDRVTPKSAMNSGRALPYLSAIPKPKSSLL